MDKENDIHDKVLAAFPGLDLEQIKLLCLMAYLGDTPGNFALKQLYGAKYASAMQKLALLDHTKYTKAGRVARLCILNLSASHWIILTSRHGQRRPSSGLSR